MANFSRPGMQHSLTFDNLTADKFYTFTIMQDCSLCQHYSGCRSSRYKIHLLHDFCFHFVDCGVIEQLYMYTHIYMHAATAPPPHYHGYYHHSKPSTLPANCCPSGWRLWWWLYCWNHHWFSHDHLCRRSGTKQEVSDFFLTFRMCGILQYHNVKLT